MKKLFAFLLAFICLITGIMLSSCSRAVESTPVEPENFRVTAYLVCGDGLDEKSFDYSNLGKVTDIIVFGNVTFDEKGELTVSKNIENDLAIISKHMNGQNLYLNILGPGSQSDSDDWNEQMYDLADRHTKAFESGKLENNIKAVLDKYGFDGIVFDYEFPLRKKDWKAYDKFIVSLDTVLGDSKKIGMSMVGWNLKQSKEAMQATDFFEVMSYDLWDDDGNHATVEIAKDDIEKFVKKGYDKADLDLGVPFYARPTTREAFWYDYKSYYDKIDENGLCKDSKENLVISFNTYDVINEKTKWAIENGLGGMMIWHYACDVSADNPKSLFNAIDTAKNEAIQDKKD